MPEKILATNKQAGFNYEIIDKFEAGIKLTGPEAKAAKLGQINLKGGYATLDYDNKQRPRLILKNCRINKYAKSGYAQDKYDPLRDRELLLSKREISSLIGKMNTRGLTLVPFSVYTIRRLVKIELVLVKGKTKADKREQIKNRDIDRRIRQKLSY